MIVVLVANAIKNAEEGVGAGQLIFGYSLGCFDRVGLNGNLLKAKSLKFKSYFSFSLPQ